MVNFTHEAPPYATSGRENHNLYSPERQPGTVSGREFFRSLSPAERSEIIHAGDPNATALGIAAHEKAISLIPRANAGRRLDADAWRQMARERVARGYTYAEFLDLLPLDRLDQLIAPARRRFRIHQPEDARFLLIGLKKTFAKKGPEAPLAWTKMVARACRRPEMKGIFLKSIGRNRSAQKRANRGEGSYDDIIRAWQERANVHPSAKRDPASEATASVLVGRMLRGAGDRASKYLRACIMFDHLGLTGIEVASQLGVSGASASKYVARGRAEAIALIEGTS